MTTHAPDPLGARTAIEELIRLWSFATAGEGRRPAEEFARLIIAVIGEAGRQDAKFPWPQPMSLQADARLSELFEMAEKRSRQLLESGGCWAAVLGEEIGEVSRETDPELKVRELVQVATAALSWALAIRENRESEAMAAAGAVDS